MPTGSKQPTRRALQRRAHTAPTQAPRLSSGWGWLAIGKYGADGARVDRSLLHDFARYPW
jgi:hypothetical protein